LICCWTACPGCRCCRCCERKRRSPWILKLIVLILIALLSAATVVCSLLALRGQWRIQDGMDSVVCSTARVLDATLSGDEENNFIGLLPLLDEFDSLRSNLDDGSDFVTQVSDIVKDTAEVERAEFIVTQSLKLLEDTLNLPENKDYPGVEEMGGAVQGLSTAVAEGVARALAMGREEVEKQFTSDSRAELQGALDEAVLPLTDAKETVRSSMRFFLEDDFGNMRRLLVLGTTVAIVSIAVGFGLIGACGCSAGVLCTFAETQSSKQNRGISPCACTSWCCGWFYAYLAFLLGGLMLVITVPLSSTCLVMDDMDSQMVQDIMPGLGVEVDMESDEVLMIGDIIDACFSKATPTGQSLTDIVYFMEDGKKVTISQKIKNQTTDPINAEFANIEEKIGSEDTKMANNENVAELKEAFKSFENATKDFPLTLGYRCDIFQNELGLDCDVKDMTKVGDAWMNECVQGTGDEKTMQKKEKTCTSREFAEYIGDWSERLDAILVRMDDSVEQTTSKIVNNLKTLVTDTLIEPVDQIVSKAECSFLKSAYADVITGFCYQGVVGLRYFAQAYICTGTFTLALIIVLYLLWRVAVDNENMQEDAALKQRREERAAEEQAKAIGTTAI